MPNVNAQPISLTSGPQLIAGDVVMGLAALTGLNASGPLTAHAGGTQALATQLVNGLNEVGTTATNNDSVQLPLALPGTVVFVANSGAATLAVYGRYGSSDTIDGTAGATGTTQTTGVDNLYFCAAAGRWRKL